MLYSITLDLKTLRLQVFHRVVGLFMCLIFAGNLAMPLSAAANEEANVFAVKEGFLSASIRKLVSDHGWFLVWDSEEDRVIDLYFNISNPSLEIGLSNLLTMYKGEFVADLYRGNQVVRITAAAPGIYVDLPENTVIEIPSAETASGKPTKKVPSDSAANDPPDSPKPILEPEDLPPFKPLQATTKEEILTVQMLDLPQAWENKDSEAKIQMPAIVAKLPPPESKSIPEQNPPKGEVTEPSKAGGGSWSVVLFAKAQEIGFDVPLLNLSDAEYGPVLQILAAKNKEKVESELSELLALGYDARVQEFQQGDTLWYRLQTRVPQGQSIEDATASLEDLGYSVVWVVPRDFSQKDPSVAGISNRSVPGARNDQQTLERDSP